VNCGTWRRKARVELGNGFVDEFIPVVERVVIFELEFAKALGERFERGRVEIMSGNAVIAGSLLVIQWFEVRRLTKHQRLAADRSSMQDMFPVRHPILAEKMSLPPRERIQLWFPAWQTLSFLLLS
jgi:hypothetical protein